MPIEPTEDLNGQTFDGFTVEVDAAQQRGDIILDRATDRLVAELCEFLPLAQRKPSFKGT